MEGNNPDLLAPAPTVAMQQQVPVFRANTPPMGTTKLPQPYYFHCSVPGANMHRQDGKKIAFVRNVCKTDIQEDVQYLMREIDNGNPYLRVATDVEIDTYNMAVDPKGTMTEKIKAELEPQLRQELEARIRAELQAEVAAANGSVSEAEALTKDGTKLGGVDYGNAAGVQARIAASRQGKAVVTPVMQSQAAPIKPVSTVDVAGTAASSSSTSK